MSSHDQDTPSPDVIPSPPSYWLNGRPMTMKFQPDYSTNFRLFADDRRDKNVVFPNQRSVFDNTKEFYDTQNSLNEIEIPDFGFKNINSGFSNRQSYENESFSSFKNYIDSIGKIHEKKVHSTSYENDWDSLMRKKNSLFEVNLNGARSLTNLNEIGRKKDTSRKWASIVSSNPPSNKIIFRPKVTLAKAEESLNSPDEINNLEKLDIYIPKTVWLMIRVGSNKVNKNDVKSFITQMCSTYNLTPEEFGLFYHDPKKPDNAIIRVSNKNYEKINGKCSVTDPRMIINGQQYSFRRISPVIQCFLCFSFDHYSSNCLLGYKRCELCSEEFTFGHICKTDTFCINCKNQNRGRLNHSPKSLQCPLVFDRCQQIAKRIVSL